MRSTTSRAPRSFARSAALPDAPRTKAVGESASALLNWLAFRVAIIGEIVGALDSRECEAASIRLHIVAPDERRAKVMNEIRRPIFSLIERRPLAKTCSFLSYDTVRDLSNLPHLEHTSDSILQEFEDFADE